MCRLTAQTARPPEQRRRPGTARPRRRRHHPAGDARRPAHRPGHRRQHGGRLPAHRGRGRRGPPRAATRTGPSPEAYCWSNLTSGNAPAPCGCCCCPSWSSTSRTGCGPAAQRLRRTPRLYGVLVRLLALSLTVLLTAAACEVALDLVAWQCAGSAACAATAPGSASSSARRDGWWAQPGRRLALAALVPAALVGLLWYLSNRTWSAYESQRPLTGADRTAAGRTGGDTPTPRLRAPAASAPRSAGPASGTAAGSWPGCAPRTPPPDSSPSRPRSPRAAARYDRGRRQRRPGVLGWLLQALLVAGAARCALGGLPPGPQRAQARRPRSTGPSSAVLPGAALALLAVAVVYAGWSRPDWVSPGALPGDVTFGGARPSPRALLVVAPRRRWPSRLHRRAPARRGPPARPRRPGRRHAGLRARRGDDRRGRPARRRLAGRVRHAGHGASAAIAGRRCC